MFPTSIGGSAKIGQFEMGEMRTLGEPLELSEAGIPASHDAVQRGVKWLSTSQRESGRWFTRSLNGVPQHFISDTATVFAVLALKACE